MSKPRSLQSYINTSVTSGQTRDGIERLLESVGAVGFRWSTFQGRETLEAGLEWQGRNVAFRLTVDYEDDRQRKQRLRALYWYLKAKIEAIQFGLVDLEHEFLPYLLTASGRTVYEEIPAEQRSGWLLEAAKDERMTAAIICGDARAELARFPDGHFHCVVTSPPYWGLRDYGLEPLIWGGSAECQHEWGEELQPRRQSGGLTEKQLTNMGSYHEGQSSTFCRRCGGWKGSLGLEPTIELYTQHIVEVFREVRRTLRDDGTLWLNMGDSYVSNPAKGGSGTFNGRNGRGEGYARPLRRGSKQADGIVTGDSPRNRDGTPCPPGLKPKDLTMMPARVALALQSDGWWLRAEIVWAKNNPMPESVQDRPTRSHEMVYLLTKRGSYFWDAAAVREEGSPNTHRRAAIGADPSMAFKMDKIGSGNRNNPSFQAAMKDLPAGSGRNLRSVWTISTQPFGLEMCGSCKMIYTAAQYRRLRGGSMPRCEREVAEGEKCGGVRWLAQDGGAVCVACETFYTSKGLVRLPRAAKCRRCGSENAWLSHFATFPEALVTPCILAGSSEHGCCPECGAPWVRVVEKETSPTQRTHHGVYDPSSGFGKSGWLPGVQAVTTVGWRPGCTHEHGQVPCRVVDPFAGSGTVGVVAERLGRHSVLIELNPDYCELARHRTAQRGLTCAPQGASAPDLAVESSEGEAS